MLCDRCKKRPATVKKILTVNDNIKSNKSEINLCNECAAECGYYMNNFNSLLSNIFSMNGLYGDFGVYEKKCPVCGSSINTFNKTGKLGCSECYTVFPEEMRPLLRKIHGNCMHKGAAPYIVDSTLNTDKTDQSIQKDKEIAELKKQMQSAIEKEAFEKAAEIRDRLRVLEEGEQ